MPRLSPRSHDRKSVAYETPTMSRQLPMDSPVQKLPRRSMRRKSSPTEQEIEENKVGQSCFGNIEKETSEADKSIPLNGPIKHSNIILSKKAAEVGEDESLERKEGNSTRFSMRCREKKVSPRTSKTDSRNQVKNATDINILEDLSHSESTPDTDFPASPVTRSIARKMKCVTVQGINQHELSERKISGISDSDENQFMNGEKIPDTIACDKVTNDKDFIKPFTSPVTRHSLRQMKESPKIMTHKVLPSVSKTDNNAICGTDCSPNTSPIVGLSLQQMKDSIETSAIEKPTYELTTEKNEGVFLDADFPTSPITRSVAKKLKQASQQKSNNPELDKHELMDISQCDDIQTKNNSMEIHEAGPNDTVMGTDQQNDTMYTSPVTRRGLQLMKKKLEEKASEKCYSGLTTGSNVAVVMNETGHVSSPQTRQSLRNTHSSETNGMDSVAENVMIGVNHCGIIEENEMDPTSSAPSLVCASKSTLLQMHIKPNKPPDTEKGPCIHPKHNNSTEENLEIPGDPDIQNSPVSVQLRAHSVDVELDSVSHISESNSSGKTEPSSLTCTTNSVRMSKRRTRSAPGTDLSRLSKDGSSALTDHSPRPKRARMTRSFQPPIKEGSTKETTQQEAKEEKSVLSLSQVNLFTCNTADTQIGASQLPKVEAEQKISSENLDGSREDIDKAGTVEHNSNESNQLPMCKNGYSSVKQSPVVNSQSEPFYGSRIKKIFSSMKTKATEFLSKPWMASIKSGPGSSPGQGDFPSPSKPTSMDYPSDSAQQQSLTLKMEPNTKPQGSGTATTKPQLPRITQMDMIDNIYIGYRPQTSEEKKAALEEAKERNQMDAWHSVPRSIPLPDTNRSQFELATERNRLRYEHQLRMAEIKAQQVPKQEVKKIIRNYSLEQIEDIRFRSYTRRASLKLQRERATETLLQQLNIELKKKLCSSDIDVEKCLFILYRIQRIVSYKALLKCPELFETVRRARGYKKDLRVSNAAIKAYQTCQAMFAIPEGMVLTQVFRKAVTDNYEKTLRDRECRRLEEIKAKEEARNRELEEREEMEASETDTTKREICDDEEDENRTVGDPGGEMEAEVTTTSEENSSFLSSEDQMEVDDNSVQIDQDKNTTEYMKPKANVAPRENISEDGQNITKSLETTEINEQIDSKTGGNPEKGEQTKESDPVQGGWPGLENWAAGELFWRTQRQTGNESDDEEGSSTSEDESDESEYDYSSSDDEDDDDDDNNGEIIDHASILEDGNISVRPAKVKLRSPVQRNRRVTANYNKVYVEHVSSAEEVSESEDENEEDREGSGVAENKDEIIPSDVSDGELSDGDYENFDMSPKPMINSLIRTVKKAIAHVLSSSQEEKNENNKKKDKDKKDEDPTDKEQ